MMSAENQPQLDSNLMKFARQAYDDLRRLPELPSAYLHPWRRESSRKLAALKDAHKGERCFLIGNGPSLRQTDLTLLKNEFTFGFNRIFLAAEELHFTPSCLVSINDLVIEQSAEEFRTLQLPKFFSWRARRYLGMAEDITYLYTTYTTPKFATDVRARVWEGATVTYVALQLAYHMGFSTVILVGVDHSFVTQGQPNTTVQSEGDDPNHFSSAYFGKGFRWQLPDLETSELAYRMAREAYTRGGRQVLDATIGGKLTVFPKVEYTSLFH